MNRHASLYIFILLTFLIQIPYTATQQESIKYRVSNEKSEIVVKVFKAGLISMFGHDHVIKANNVDGFVYFNNKSLFTSSVNISLAVDSLDPDPPEIRKKFGLADTLSISERAEIKKDMISVSQLNADKYPNINFGSDVITKDSNDNYIVSGKLKVHGVTKRVIFPAKIIVRGDSLNAVGSFFINQSDFGIEPFSTVFATIKNKDKVEIIFNICALSENMIR